MTHVLSSAPLLLLALIMFASLLAVREAGGFIGRWMVRDSRDDEAEHGYILSGVLGLLALLIAFTFGLALDRHETRRDLVIAEANAIGSADMRARMLDPPDAERLTRVLREYAELRLRYGQATMAHKPPLERESEALRARIQAETLAAVQPIRLTPLASLITTGVNDAMDVGVSREAHFAARVPATVIVTLFVYALVAAGVLGAALNSARSPHRGMAALLFVLLTLALIMIVDLDRPQAGTIIASQEPMAKLVANLRQTALSAPPAPPT